MTTLYCSFCAKSQHEVAKLVAGPTVHICDECTALCFEICNPPLLDRHKEQRAATDQARDKIGDVRRHLDDLTLHVLPKLNRMLGRALTELDQRPPSPVGRRDFTAEVIGFGQALAGWAEPVATPEEDVGFVFTRLDSDFTGLPVDISVGDDTPLVIATPESLASATIAAIRHWVVEHQAALIDHWRDRIDSVQLVERLRKL